MAYELNRSELFLFTKPQNRLLFSGAGFWPIAQAGQLAVLTENSSERLARFCRQLALYRQPGKTIGAIVMNANPFTLGHRYLVEQAAAACDWLHLFVVKEDASFFSYTDRWALIEQGIAGIDNVTLHSGSAYMISRATFPGYFLKEKGVVDDCHCQIDLQLFREHLAPALGITHRVVGSEPFCPLTCAYNQRMHDILHDPKRSGPEWMAAVCAPAMALKQHMSTLKMSHPLGRLWDIDIIDSDGKSLSRRELGHPARPCLICQQDAHLCARGKHHTLDLLLDEIARRIECYERERCD